LDKPAGATSHDGVAMVRRLLNRVKTGHTGTLDPDATGVLPICIGKATRLAEYITGLPKVYQGEMVLGITTDSQDASGALLEEKPASHITKEKAEALIPHFSGEIMQIPPMVSALKKDGKRLYQLAREGQVVEREPRKITIYDLKLVCWQAGKNPKITWQIQCSSGTYIRTLFHDMGQMLGTGAHLTALRRLQVGPFLAENAYSIDTIREMVEKRDFSFILPMSYGIVHLPQVILPKNLVEKALHGIMVPCEKPGESEVYQVLSEDGTLLGMGSFQKEGLHLNKVLLNLGE